MTSSIRQSNAYDQLAQEFAGTEYRPALAYQLTPAASKNNAFCWMAWEPQINWRGGGQVAAQEKRSQILEDKRAAGVDTLGIHGMKGSGAIDRSDMTRFAVQRHARIDAQQTSRTETMRAALRLLGPQTAAELTVIAGLDNSGLVGALMRHDIDKGSVTRQGGKYAWAGDLKKKRA